MFSDRFFNGLGESDNQKNITVFADSPNTSVSNLQIPGDSSTNEVISVGQTRTELFEYQNDSDWYQIDLNAQETVAITLDASGYPASQYYYPFTELTIYDSSGAIVASNNSYTEQYISYLVFTPSASETYYIAAEGSYGDVVYSYDLSVTAVSAVDYIPGDNTTTQTISVGETRQETLESPGDSDWFALTLTPNQSVTVTLTGTDHDPNNGLGAMPFVEMLVYTDDSFRNVVALDLPYREDTASVEFTSTVGGTFYVEVVGMVDEYFGDYALTVTEIDVPQDYIPGDQSTTQVLDPDVSRSESIEHAGDSDWFVMDLEAFSVVDIGAAGQDVIAGNGLSDLDSIDVTVYDPNGNPVQHNQFFLTITGQTTGTFTTTMSGQYYVEVNSPDDTAVGDYFVFADVMPAVYAGEVSVGDVVKDTLEYGDGADFYAIELTASEPVVISLVGRDHTYFHMWSQMFDPVLTLYDSAGNIVAYNDNRLTVNSENSLLIFTPDTDGTYYIEAREHQYGVNGDYVLRVVDDSVLNTDLGSRMSTEDLALADQIQALISPVDEFLF